MDKKVLTVQMLGGFEATYGNQTVVPRDARNSKVLQLFQYLLCNRGDMVPQSDLFGIVIGGEDCANPASTLKNIVYRLRKLLEAAGMPKDCVLYKKSAYGFNGAIPCEIDVEQFSTLVEKLNSKKLSDEKALDLCTQAAALYQGEFLARASSEPWVMCSAVRYQELYTFCIQRMYDAAKDLDKLSFALDELRRAAVMYPYEEDLAYLYISCLYELGFAKEALSTYEEVVTTLMDDLGVKPSDKLHALYQEISGGMQEVTESVVDIRSKISESESGKGPYCSNLEVFSNIYQFMVRHMERSGKSVFLMLCTLSEMDGSAPKTGARLTRMVESFHEAVGQTCRRGDVYTRYSPSQFLLILMEIKQESCNIVAERLRRCFYKLPKMSRTRLECKAISAADMDNIMHHGGGYPEYFRGWGSSPEV